MPSKPMYSVHRHTRGDIMKQKEFIRTSGEMLILSLLEHRDMYGYEMIKSLLLQSDNVFELKEGTLYPMLHRLEKEGSLKSYSKKTENNRTRKYYKITNRGLQKLAEEKESWELYSKAIDSLIGFSL